MPDSSPRPPRRTVLRTGTALATAAGLATLTVPHPASAADPARRRNRKPTGRAPSGPARCPAVPSP